MNIVMSYDLLKNLYKELGAEKFFKLFDETYKNFRLYCMSQGWLESKEYILKFKGGIGDIIIEWM